MKKQKITGGIIIAISYFFLSCSADAQDKNLNKNNNFKGVTPDSVNSRNTRNPQSDEDIQKMPMNNLDNAPQTTTPAGQDGSLPLNHLKQTPSRLNRNIPDSTNMHRHSGVQTQRDSAQHLNTAPARRQDLSTPRDTLKKPIRSNNKNIYLVPDTTLRK
jgi:hypothetical protein